MAEKEYIRLARPRSRSGFQVVTMARSSLWLGKDHLLCVETNGYTESYKRFYFRDIQGVMMCESKGFLITNAILGPIGGLFLLIGFLASANSMPAAITLWCFAALFAIPLAMNLVGGPTCIVRLRTAVQEDEVPALGRIRKARAVLARIRPMIAEAQGELTRSEIAERFSQIPPVLGAGPAAAASSPDTIAPSAVGP